MSLSTNEAFTAYVFEHRHGLVALLGVAALFILWMDVYPTPVDGGGNARTLSFAVMGTVLILVGVIIRLWSGLYIGGHKNRELVTKGPYSLVRNPLYTGNLVSALGLMLMTQSLIVTLVVMLGLSVIYVATIRHEERKLEKLFADDYTLYCQSTPRIIPRRAALRDMLSGTGTGDTISYRNLACELKRAGIFVFTGFLVLLGVAGLH